MRVILAHGYAVRVEVKARPIASCQGGRIIPDKGGRVASDAYLHTATDLRVRWERKCRGADHLRPTCRRTSVEPILEDDIVGRDGRRGRKASRWRERGR